MFKSTRSVGSASTPRSPRGDVGSLVIFVFSPAVNGERVAVTRSFTGKEQRAGQKESISGR
jgi:hypothetical protein